MYCLSSIIETCKNMQAEAEEMETNSFVERFHENKWINRHRFIRSFFFL